VVRIAILLGSIAAVPVIWSIFFAMAMGIRP